VKLGIVKRVGLLFTSLAVIGLAFAAGASQQASSASGSILNRVQSEHSLIVATEQGDAPYSMIGSNGELTGFDVYIAKSIASTLGAKVTFRTVNDAGRITALQTNQVEMVVANFTITPKRALTIDFSRPYLVVHGQFVTLAKRNDIKSLNDLNKPSIRVAVSRGGTAEFEVPAALPRAHTVTYNSVPDTVQALNAGQVDAISQDNLFNGTLLKNHPGQYKEIPGYYSSEMIGIGLPKGDYEWARWIDLWVQDFVNSNQENQLFKKWFGFPVPPLDLK
jgi:polar amino acid transport system substrate-binding protein